LELDLKIVKIVAVLLLIYVGVVVLFESLLGYFQPAGQGTLLITTTDAKGGGHDRVVSRLESDGKLYVAANHWPRAWYTQALDNPEVAATINGDRRSYVAVPVTGSEHDRVDADNALGIGFRILTGFPPRYFLRLDPV
jgi:hypothetical protein